MLFGKNQQTQNTDKQVSSEELPAQKVEVTPIQGTPFGCAKRADKDYVIIFGRHMITDKSFTSPEHAEVWTRKTDWNPILNVIGIYVDEKLNLLNKKNENS